MDSTGVRIVDLSKLRSTSFSERSAAIHDIGRACQAMGFFQVLYINHSCKYRHGFS
jgi:isopenicillin N synthase-like dioxygenase